MSNDELKELQRDFHFSFAELIANFEICERLFPIDTLLEMCETLAGIMAEQIEIVEDINNMGSEKDWHKIRDKFRRPLLGERFYSSHIVAICDMIRLAKHFKELLESKDELKKTMKKMEVCDNPLYLDIQKVNSILEANPMAKTLRHEENS